MTTHLRVLINFSRATDDSLKVIAITVHQGLTGNPAFPSPIVPLTTLESAITAFSDTRVAQEQGGTMATAAKKNKREALVTLLRKLAVYVEDSCDGNLATLLSSGFTAASTSHVQAQLAAPFILRILNGNTGQLLVRLREPIANAKCYEVRYATIINQAVGPWQSGGMFTNSRALALNGLTAGTNYAIEVRAIGGSTKYSEWSAGSNHMSL